MDNKDILSIDLLNPSKLIQVNELKEIKNPVVFVRDNIPTEDGLLSNDIFGISKNDRGGIFAYIDLTRSFLHPLVYKIWGSMDKNIKNIVHGTKNYKINDKGNLIEDDNGRTGLDFLESIIGKIHIKRTGSRRRDTYIKFLEKNRNNLFIKQCIVIPAYYRDVNTNDGYVGIGDINKLYNSLLISVRALRDTADYGISMSDATNGRVQETLVSIYDWFSDEPNLSKKHGIIRRSVLSKTTDYSSRLVISAPDLDYNRPEDRLVDLDHSAVPLASTCVNFYPFILFHLRTFFQNEFSSGTYPYIDSKTKEVKHVTLKDIDIEFSDDRLKQEIDRYIRGFSNRFIPIEIPNKEGKKLYMRFKGRNVSPENIDNPGNSPLLQRRITWCDLLYMAATESVKGKHVLLTRYPLTDYFGQFPTKVVVSSTKKTEPMFINNTLYKHYPRIREEDIGSNTSNTFIDTLQLSNLHLAIIGGDYDGDQLSVKGVFTDEANKELDKHMNTLTHYIGVDGINVRISSNEAIQAIYNLTKVLEGSNLINPKF